MQSIKILYRRIDDIIQYYFLGSLSGEQKYWHKWLALLSVATGWSTGNDDSGPLFSSSFSFSPFSVATSSHIKILFSAQ